MQHTPADHDPDDANGNVDIKNPAPVHIFSKIAADHRAKRRGGEDRHAKDAISKTALFLRIRSKDQCEGQPKERCSTCSLAVTQADADLSIPAEATQHRTQSG